MSDRTAIEWTEATWNPIRRRWPNGKSGHHCLKLSPGCQACYAGRLQPRYWGGADYPEANTATIAAARQMVADGTLYLDERVLQEPLRWKRPRRIFVCSMTDVAGEWVPDAWLDQLWAVMAATPQHTYQVLTKRPNRLCDYVRDPQTPFRVTRAMDALIVAQRARGVAPKILPIPGYPGYSISNAGEVFRDQSSAICLFCGVVSAGRASKSYCSSQCRQASHYRRQQGQADPYERAPRPMSPDVGEQGHLRVPLMRDGEVQRQLVHRLVLTTFDRLPRADEQGRHLDGNPANNHIANLCWGTQEANWQDRLRHGHGRSYAKLTADHVYEIRRLYSKGASTPYLAVQYGVSDTQIRNILDGQQWTSETPISWPLSGVWLGVSVESDAYTWRAKVLAEIPAAVRFVSAEPLLGPLPSLAMRHPHALLTDTWVRDIDWLVCGGESGGTPERRLVEPCCVQNKSYPPLPTCPSLNEGHCHRYQWQPKPEALTWVRDLRDRATAAGTAFFFKAWGGATFRSGGRLLDGREWNEMPEGRQ